MSEPTITLAYGEDWEGLYYDGLLFAENHSISVWDWINLLEQKFDIKVKVIEQQLEDGDRYPHREKDLGGTPVVRSEICDYCRCEDEGKETVLMYDNGVDWIHAGCEPYV